MIYVTINVLNILTTSWLQKGLDKQPRPRSDCFWRSSLIRVLPVCYSDELSVNSSPKNLLTVWKLPCRSSHSAQYCRYQTYTKVMPCRILFSPDFFCCHCPYHRRSGLSFNQKHCQKYLLFFKSQNLALPVIMFMCKTASYGKID